MSATARHRGTRSGLRRRSTGLASRRCATAVVGSLLVVSLVGYSSHPIQDVDGAGGATSTQVVAVRAAMTASAPVTLLPAVVAASVTEPRETVTTAAGGEAGDDIPGPAHAAYQRASSVMGEAASACELSWTLLAGIGRVESDHGRYGAAVLGDDGVSRPHIVGMALDGTGRVAEIRDSDDGRLDGDGVWDRAVGPMQFLPTTWSLAGVDGDGDGVRNPHDLDDAALAAGVYLCAGGGDLSRSADVRAALFRYNRSASYVALVMAYEQRYRTGRFTVESGPVLPTAIVAAGAGPVLRATPRGTRPAQPAAPTGDRVDRPVPVPAERPLPADEAARPPAGATRPVAPLPDPDPAPAPEPAPDPASEPATDLDSADSEGSTPEPVDPDREIVTGEWTACDDGYCLDGSPLLLGDPELLDESAVEDYDGDGQTETYAVELSGLLETTVVVVVDKQETGWTVFSINGLDYPRTSLPPTSPSEPVE
ncbi:MAG TPA: lytic murein transglycosylase [Nocardioidaceae bacterium]